MDFLLINFCTKMHYALNATKIILIVCMFKTSWNFHIKCDSCPDWSTENMHILFCMQWFIYILDIV